MLNDSLDQIQKDINTELNNSGAISSIITRIVNEVKQIKQNQTNLVLLSENESLKKKLEESNKLINSQDTQLKAFANVLRLPQNLTPVQQITKASELIAELDALKLKK